MITAQIDTTGMDEVLRKLSAATNLPMRDVTLSEGRSIMQTCLDRTLLSSKGFVDARTRRKFNQYGGGDYGKFARGVYPKISISPKAGRTWWVEPGPKYYIVKGGDRRWSDARWSAYRNDEGDRKADMVENVAEQRRRRGLPKQVWYLLAELMGYEITAAQEVIDATVNRKRLRAANLLIREEGNIFEIHGTNFSIASRKKRGAEIISEVIRGRVKYFRRNLEKGVFDSLEQVHRAYPNLLKINR